MASCFYNGVLLPEIPSDALKNYPYCWIRNNTRTGYYDLMMAKSPWWQSDSTTIYTASYADGIQWYRTPMMNVGDDWTFNQSWTTNGGFADESDRNIIWANHNIPTGTVTATTIYFVGSSAIPDKDVYRIQKDTMTGIADQVRRLCKTEATMTPAVIESKLGGLNIELMETYVISDSTEQTIYPDEGYYGFSKITVGAVDLSGGSGSGGSGGEGDSGYVDAGSIGFGNEYTEEEVETGNHIYATNTIIPSPPAYGYAVLFVYGDSFDLYASTSEFYYYYVVGGRLATRSGTTIHHYSLSNKDENPAWADEGYVSSISLTYVPAWTSHDIYNEDKTTLWKEANPEYFRAETVTQTVVTPASRDETYTVDGNDLNAIMGAIQQITGTQETLTPEEAAKALEDYYASLNEESNTDGT